MSHNPAAFGLYPSTKALHFGADALRAAKFRHTDISVMYADGFGAQRAREAIENTGRAEDQSESLGGVLSELSRIGAIELPDDGPFMAAGPILESLISTSDGLLDSLRGLGIPEGAAQRFEGRLKQGGLLLSVQCDDEERTGTAQRIFQETGAHDVTATTAQ
jgi:hypothetical protein